TYPSLSYHPPAPPDTTTLSLHDALPLCVQLVNGPAARHTRGVHDDVETAMGRDDVAHRGRHCLLVAHVDPHVDRGIGVSHVEPRSEEHTSELQSRGHLVCRLLLEKKKTP